MVVLSVQGRYYYPKRGVRKWPSILHFNEIPTVRTRVTCFLHARAIGLKDVLTKIMLFFQT